MNLLKVTNGVAASYSLRKLREDNPSVSFPVTPSAELLAEYGVFYFEVDPKPTADVVSVGDFYENNGVWRRGWDSRPYTDAERREDMIVTPRQARLALLATGDLAAVEAALQALPEPNRTAAITEWEYATTVERASAWITQMTVALGKTEAEMDALFDLAATL